MKVLMVLTSHDTLGDTGKEDRLLARGAGSAVLRLQGRRCRDHPRLAEGRPAASRPEERRADVPDRPYATLQR